MGGLIEQNIIAIAAALVSFVSAWAIIKSKVEVLESRVSEHEKKLQDIAIIVERRGQQTKEIYNRLDKLDALKIEGNLAEMTTELKYIRKLLEDKLMIAG